MVGGWIAWWVSLLYYVLLYCCSTGLWVGGSVRSCVHGLVGFFVFLFFFLPLYRPRAGIVQRTTSVKSFVQLFKGLTAQGQYQVIFNAQS